ncbi:MAG: alginate export family protein [Candidatus Riflebacteria bacterium]|nr:alginate export family protein [Candidatus Riflebacteria bacterium]
MNRSPTILAAAVAAIVSVSGAGGASAASVGRPATVGPEAAKSRPTTQASRLKITTTSRTRVEAWNWFDPGNPAVGKQNRYTYGANLLKITGTRKLRHGESFAELAMPSFIGLPDDAVAAAPAGQLGPGATYRATNGGQEFTVFIKQAGFLHRFEHHPKLALKLGRFEFAEGSECFTTDPTLDWLKRERIGHRLLGNFGFTHIQRSFDGFTLSHDTARDHWIVAAVRPTVGCFNLDANLELTGVTVGYFAYTLKGSKKRGDGRAFLIVYDDDRDVLKTDNRTAAARKADTRDITLATVGGHYLKKLGPVDLLAWGALQWGDWGTLDHDAWAWDFELGYQPSGTALKPWLRAGVCRTSGDSNSRDGKHQTFSQLLPTARVYARTPFYNMMNLQDAFVSLLLRPSKKVTLRTEYHDLTLQDAADLWYLGGGAYESQTFGFAGRPSGGSRSLARLVDLGVEWKAGQRTTVNIYGGRALGDSVIRSIYPAGPDGSFAMAEVMHRF